MAPNSSMLPHPSVLIVEDDSIIAWHLKTMVERAGYSVCATAATEEGAVAAAEQHRPAVVLMDVRLARGGDGVRAAEAIRQQQQSAIIFCTAHAQDPSFRERAALFERALVLAKPVHEDLLKQAIEQAVGG
jgi:two-component system, response regulator PdtaR